MERFLWGGFFVGSGGVVEAGISVGSGLGRGGRGGVGSGLAVCVSA